MQDKRIIEVVGAIICDGDRYLVGQRAAHKTQGGLWEFMGGKIEPGETPEQALARECREELDLEIENERIIDSVVHEYPEKTIRWVTTDEMREMDFAPADKELIQKLFA